MLHYALCCVVLHYALCCVVLCRVVSSYAELCRFLCWITDCGVLRCMQVKEKRQREWSKGSVKVICATIAFGMGINKVAG